MKENKVKFLSVSDAAVELAVSESTIRRWVRQGRLRAVRTSEGRGGRLRILESSVREVYPV